MFFPAKILVLFVQFKNFGKNLTGYFTLVQGYEDASVEIDFDALEERLDYEPTDIWKPKETEKKKTNEKKNDPKWTALKTTIEFSQINSMI